jgi:hypothetical protein
MARFGQAFKHIGAFVPQGDASATTTPLMVGGFPARGISQGTVILPRYSESGRYMVAVTHDRTGNDLLAQSSAAATGNGDREEISVDLDLLKSKPGAYFLSTTHEQDQASYYYPLQIK